MPKPARRRPIHLDRLVAQPAQPVGEAVVRRREPQGSLAAVGEIERAGVPSDRLGQGRELAARPLPFRLFADSHLDAALPDRQIRERDARVPQLQAHAVAEFDQHRVAQRIGVDLDQEARPALAPEGRFGPLAIRLRVPARFPRPDLFEQPGPDGRLSGCGAGAGRPERRDDDENRKRRGERSAVHGSPAPVWTARCLGAFSAENRFPPGSSPGQAFSGKCSAVGRGKWRTRSRPAGGKG